MADTATLNVARRALLDLKADQAQSSLADQAADCVAIVAALGYYDLADHLRDNLANRGRQRN